MRAAKDLVFALLAGTVFGVGLILSGMADPAKVQGFLDVAGAWDPSLALVMGGAILVAMPVFQWCARHGAARVAQATPVRSIEPALIVGSVLFGIGWGLSGFCPGPAVVAAGGGNGQALWYALAMATGILLGAHPEQTVGAGNRYRIDV